MSGGCALRPQKAPLLPLASCHQPSLEHPQQSSALRSTSQHLRAAPPPPPPPPLPLSLSFRIRRLQHNNSFSSPPRQAAARTGLREGGWSAAWRPPSLRPFLFQQAYSGASARCRLGSSSSSSSSKSQLPFPPTVASSILPFLNSLQPLLPRHFVSTQLQRFRYVVSR